MRPFIQNNPPRNPQPSQFPLHLPQRRLRPIPAPALVNRHIHILDPEMPHERQHRIIPMRLQNLFVIPVRAGDEDSGSVVVVVRGVGGRKTVGGGGEEEIAQAEGFEDGAEEEDGGAEAEET